MRRFDVIVVGAGAAGVMAAGVVAQRGMQVLLCEQMEKPQRKVRITGKGRCNLTNLCSEEEFLQKVHGSTAFFAPALHAFTPADTVKFFERIGLEVEVERGRRVFPSSGRAWDVAEAHINWCRSHGALVECNTRVRTIHVARGHISAVTIECNGVQERISTSNVVIATGGASYPATGSTGDGYRLAHELGHTIIPVRPSLAPLEATFDTFALKGLLLKNISASLWVDSTERRSEFGDLEFTPWVAGPVTLRMSRDAVDALIDGHQVELKLDLKPALSDEQLIARMARELEADDSLSAGGMLRKLMPAQLVPYVARQAGLHTADRAPIDDTSRQSMVDAVKRFVIPVADYRPFEEAIVTAGGVDTAEVDPQTMSSKLVRGLYFAGEVLDLDADTGGYNLQVAYSTGRMAGQLLTPEL